MTETFYDTLGVPEDATSDEITAAYREKVKETHPDVSDAPDAEERFKRIKRAKEVLTDTETRERYDNVGHEQYVDSSDGIADGAAYWADDGPMGDDETASSTERSSGTTGPFGWDEQTGSDEADQTDTTASTEESADWQRTETSSSSRQQSTGTTGTGSSGYATRSTYTHQSYDSVRIPLTPQTLIQIGAMFVLYPVFVLAAVLPAFPLSVNVLVGLCTLFVVAYLLSIPEVAIVVFGAWSLLTPLLFLSLSGLSLLSLYGLLALVASWFPFGLALLTRAALQP